MNKERRKRLIEISDKLKSLMEDLEQVRADEEDADRLKGRECTEQELQEIQIKRAMDEYIKQIERITGKHIRKMKIDIDLETRKP